MSRTARVGGSAAAILLLALVCAPTLRAQFLSPPRADSTVRYLITRLAVRDTTRMVVPIDAAGLASQGIDRDSLLRMLLAGFDIGPVREIRVIDRTDFHPFNATRVDEQLAYHAVGERDSRLVFVSATTDSGVTRLTGIRWQQAPADLRQMNPFKLSGKSWLHYVVLGFAVLIPLFSLATAIVAAVSRVRFKWLWAVGSLVSFGKLSIVWTDTSAADAVMRFMPINVQVLGAGVLKYPLYAPWVISIGLPVFAIAYWFVAARRRPSHALSPSSVAA